MIFEKINSEVISAMKSKQSDRLLILRTLVSECKNAFIASRTDSSKETTPSDSDCLVAINKAIKQREGALEQYTKASREDLAEVERFQIGIIREFLPKQLSDDEISVIIDETIFESGFNSKKDMGKLIGAVKPKVFGKADMRLVNSIIQSKLV